MSAAGPHRKLIKHYHDPGDLHELTFSCYRRQPLLTNDTWRLQLARCIDSAGKELAIQLAAFVFMPEHVHLLVLPTDHQPAIDRYLARVKQPLSKWVKQQLVGDCPNFAESAEQNGTVPLTLAFLARRPRLRSRRTAKSGSGPFFGQPATS